MGGGGVVKHGCLASAVLLPKALHYCVASPNVSMEILDSKFYVTSVIGYC